MRRRLRKLGPSGQLRLLMNLKRGEKKLEEVKKAWKKEAVEVVGY